MAANVTRFVGYANSLRPFSVTSLSGRALRRGVRLARLTPAGRQIFPVQAKGLRFSGSARACPVVDAEGAIARLRELGAETDTFYVDASAFARFLRDARFPKWYHPHNGTPTLSFLEKTLEHFVASRLLDVGSADTYLDVGADSSPFSAIAERLFGCRGYQLDAAYRGGVHSRYIGSDVRHIPLASGSVSKMASHCAFDHFQGDADVAFIAESARLLGNGGRLCIIPLYLSDETTNFIDPAACLSLPTPDDNARLIDVTGWGYEFSRYYSPEDFLNLAATQSDALSLRIYEIRGTDLVDPSCYLRLAAVFERK